MKKRFGIRYVQEASMADEGRKDLSSRQIVAVFPESQERRDLHAPSQVRQRCDEEVSIERLYVTRQKLPRYEKTGENHRNPELG